ncbi:aminoglycoside adenylyltransferase domain-containing protein [Amycolatopsis sp. BJA-103]|uniref:aminoglycoside adenylyltransferase domain-containing protein n=1 Tax=Amycolatopsis sp. BJA-103 TaxID=1911175 RepID=UPI000C75A248|nr:aminoglycoside adenylyltransferase domain-containing protein [Amycolatopsis sp. BJA-103]AUI59543.1 nucleotidyltransferase [Amycolatopsis sp. BJA-103]PNE17013.1 nucleotidyltransferase [Amycolatopsis sp. BJA-103]
MSIEPLLDHLDRENPGDVIGSYLYGSAVAGGLRPDSDVDLLLVTRRSLTGPERASLVSLLLGVSGWRGHAARFPEVADRRPIELTVLVAGDRFRRDFQYGEWLREDFVAGRLPEPAEDPDVVILVATAHAAHRVLRGPALAEVLEPVAGDELRQSVRVVVPGLIEEIDGDERNVLLTLARVLATLETGEVVTKDAAAAAVAPTLDGVDRELLELARAGYLGLVQDDWAGLRTEAASLAHLLAGRARGV